jgi:hypothetical protein
VLFALLAIHAPAFDAPPAGDEFAEYVSAPADSRSNATTVVSATLSVAEDLDEEEDQEEDAVLALAAIHSAAATEYQATDACLTSFLRLSAYSCTGPPTL